MATLLAALKKFPDFYCELKWEFKSWVPLVSRFCPHDTYKVWKCGSSFRADTTLTGFENLSWKRGNVSFLFLGEETESPGNVVAMDHEKQVVEHALDNVRQHTDEESDQEISELMKHCNEIIRSDIVTDNVKFDVMKGWFGGEKTERVGDFDTKLFSMTGLDYTATLRRRATRPSQNSDAKKKQEAVPMTDDEFSLPAGYFDKGTSDPKGKGYGLLYKHEKVSQTHKSVKATAYLAKDFPHTIEELMPIFEVLAPKNKHNEKMKQFIMLIPDSGFPLKLDIPIFPTISAVVTFLKFEHIASDSDTFSDTVSSVRSLFVIPPHYNRSKIQMQFDFQQEDAGMDGEAMQAALEGEHEGHEGESLLKNK